MTDPDPTHPDPTHLSLLSIGAFARASRLTHKALRLYADLGLLPPARVDADTGYRSYSPAQLPDARLIGLLRQLDLPLADIRALLYAAPSERPAHLRSQWSAVNATHARRDALARYVQHTLQGDDQMTDFDVQTRHVPAQQVACLTRRIHVHDLPAAIREGFRTLSGLVGTHTTAGASAAPMVIYHGEVNADSDGPIELCWPYTGPLTPAGEVVLRVEPAHHEAYVTLSAAQFEFPAILRAYDAVALHARQLGTSGSLACRELYPHDPAAGAGPADAGELAGEVAWPYTPGTD